MSKKIVILDYRVSEEIKEIFEQRNYEVVLTQILPILYDEISGHTDIQFFRIENKIIYAPNIDKMLINTLKDMLNGGERDIEFIEGKTYLQSKYPNDIAYNACIIGKNLIGNIKYLDETILSLAMSKNYNVININQGYAKCSIAVVDGNSCIVQDKNIYKCLKKNNIDALLLEEDMNISLLNEHGNISTMHGFIGGAMGSIDNDVIIFGSISNKITKEKIQGFINSKGRKLVEVKNSKIIDYGSNIIM